MKLITATYQYLELPEKAGNYADVLDKICQSIKEVMPSETQPAQKGLYLVTEDSGARAAIGLWKEALEQGPDFANPRNFPLTLASAPAAYLARQLKYSGPNITLIGGAENLVHACDQIHFDLSNDLIEEALLFALDWKFNNTPQSIAQCFVLRILAIADLPVLPEPVQPVPASTFLRQLYSA